MYIFLDFSKCELPTEQNNTINKWIQYKNDVTQCIDVNYFDE